MKLKNKTLCFDIDGIICKTPKKNYNSARPIKKVIKLINKLYIDNYIIIFTARYMGRNNENVGLAKKQGFKKTFNQLTKWKLKFHKLKFGKPSYDMIVDDKSFFFKKNWISVFEKKYLK